MITKYSFVLEQPDAELVENGMTDSFLLAQRVDELMANNEQYVLKSINKI